MNGQIDIFDLTMPQFKIDNKIRLIELFAGYGSQAMALDVIGADYEHYKVVEFDKYAVQSYNAVHGTNFEPTDIRNVHGKDLEICDTDQFTYMLTYSFPCTDLSVAGKMQGMKKGSGTRSGLLWEVERIMQELKAGQGELPQVLFMENVPQVISSANIKDFHAWQDFLTSLGYTSHVETLNARDYGVAQNRERCFMFSFLGEFNYKFPDSIPLKKTMKDYLEDEVDEKYYINTEKAQKLICQLIDNGNLQGCIGNVNPSGNGLNGNVYSGDIAPTLTTNKGEGQKICIDLSINHPKEKIVSNCITARENRGISNQESVGNGVLQIENTELENICINDRGFKNKEPQVCDGYIPTLRAETHGNLPKVIVAMRGRNPDNPSDRTPGLPTEQRLEPNSQGICNALTSVQKDNMVLENSVVGTLYSGASEQFGCGYMPDICKKLKANKDDTSILIKQATETGICRIESRYRIRKLTPRECFRLMGVNEADIEKMMSVNSNSQCYKQAGNSIVVNCMVAMFSNLNIQGLPTWDEIKERGN